MEKLKRATSEQIEAALSRWTLPQIPESVCPEIKVPKTEFNVVSLSRPIQKKLTLTHRVEEKAAVELAIVDWLYHLVRANIKRGRVFELGDVLSRGYADCLGYAKLLCWLGKKFAVDISIVEVIIDNGGRYLPHYINLVKLAHSERRFVDMWYGSTNIRHQRIGAQVKVKGRWKIEDLGWNELERVKEIKGLPDKAVDGITYYIIGNRHLEKGIAGLSEELDKAIECYDLAIKLYPSARFYFNRAVAFENKGKCSHAKRDYARAFKDEASIARILAREHDEITGLTELDRKGIGLQEQERYLLHKGFITGSKNR
ncbi:hypothetical protein ACFLV4_01580 [Chloroflexota bacterium]